MPSRRTATRSHAPRASFPGPPSGRTAPWSAASTRGDGSIISRDKNGNLTSDGRPNPQLLQKLSQQQGQPQSAQSSPVANAPPNPPFNPADPVASEGGESGPLPISADAVLSGGARPRVQFPRFVPPQQIAGNPADVGRALQSAGNADRQNGDIGRQYGSARVTPDAPPQIPTSTQVVGRTTDAQGNTVETLGNGGTAVVPSQSQAAPANGGSGIYVNGVPQTQGSDGRYVADLSGAGRTQPPQVPTPTPVQAPLAPGVAAAISPALIAQAAGLVPPVASSGQPTTSTPSGASALRAVRAAAPNADLIAQARAQVENDQQTKAVQNSGTLGDYSNPNDGSYSAGARGVAGSLPAAPPMTAPDGASGVASLGSASPRGAVQTAANGAASSFQGSFATTDDGPASTADGGLKFPMAPKVGDTSSFSLSTGAPSSDASSSGISGFGDTNLGSSKPPTVPTASLDKPISLGLNTGADPSKPPQVPTTTSPGTNASQPASNGADFVKNEQQKSEANYHAAMAQSQAFQGETDDDYRKGNQALGMS